MSIKKYMAKKNYSLKINSPVVTVIAALSVLAMIFDTFIIKGKVISNAFTCHASKASGTFAAFNFKSAADYARMIFYVLGSSSWHSMFSGTIILLLLGANLEERYGSKILLLMIFTSSLVTGVLTACISTVPVSGADGIIFTMLILISISEISKKEIPLTWLMVLVLFISYKLYSTADFYHLKKASIILEKNICVFIQLIGGICGSLFGFLVAPKNKKASGKETSRSKKTVVYTEEYDEDNDRTIVSAPKKGSSSSSDETIIGSISL